MLINKCYKTKKRKTKLTNLHTHVLIYSFQFNKTSGSNGKNSNNTEKSWTPVLLSNKQLVSIQRIYTSWFQISSAKEISH